MDKDFKSKYRELSEAAKPFVSEMMELHTRIFPDNTSLNIEVPTIDGHTRTITLGQWRKLWKIFESQDDD